MDAYIYFKLSQLITSVLSSVLTVRLTYEITLKSLRNFNIAYGLNVVQTFDATFLRAVFNDFDHETIIYPNTKCSFFSKLKI